MNNYQKLQNIFSCVVILLKDVWIINFELLYLIIYFVLITTLWSQIKLHKLAVYKTLAVEKPFSLFSMFPLFQHCLCVKNLEENYYFSNKFSNLWSFPLSVNVSLMLRSKCWRNENMEHDKVGRFFVNGQLMQLCLIIMK